MATRVTRKFGGAAVNMLTACATIIEHAIEHQSFLVTKRAAWADPYFPNLKQKINDAFVNHLGLDANKEKREATHRLLQIQQRVLIDLGDIKVQIEVDFGRTRRKEILKQLGFEANYVAATRKNQQRLVDLLFAFQKNMTADLQAEFADKGIDTTLIANILDSANIFRDANITQEASKSSSVHLTAASVTALNEIYEEVMGVAKVARRFFKDDKTVQAQFSYSKVMNRQS